MKTVMGVKLIDNDEIFKYSGGRTPLCNHLKSLYSYGIDFFKDIKEENQLIFDTNKPGSLRFNMLKQYKFVFVPSEVVHERFFAHSIIGAMTMIKGVLIDSQYQHRADEIADRYENRYTELSRRYNSFDDIFGTQCYLFLFDDGKLEDIIIAHPPIIMKNVIDKPTDYQCATCNKVVHVDNKSIDSFLPEMKYEVIDNTIYYYCTECCNRPGIKKLKHVGE